MKHICGCSGCTSSRTGHPDAPHSPTWDREGWLQSRILPFELLAALSLSLPRIVEGGKWPRRVLPQSWGCGYSQLHCITNLPLILGTFAPYSKYPFTLLDLERVQFLANESNGSILSLCVVFPNPGSGGAVSSTTCVGTGRVACRRLFVPFLLWRRPLFWSKSGASSFCAAEQVLFLHFIASSLSLLSLPP